MSNDATIMRQRARDAEYLAACKAAGIKPDAPSYYAPGVVIEGEAADGVGHNGGPKKNGSTIRTRADDPEPLKDGDEILLTQSAVVLEQLILFQVLQ
jgi:hypothetical protein